MRVVVAMVTVLVTLVVAPVCLAEGPSSSYTTYLYGQAAIFTGPGSVPGHGAEAEWTPAFAGVSGTPNSVGVNVTPPGPSQGSWGIGFAAPAGETLRPGVYDPAEESLSDDTAQLSATFNGAACIAGTGALGRFEIKDIAYDPTTGNLTRLWVMFELDGCSSGPIFGEIRLGEPADDPVLSSTPSMVRWPAYDFGTAMTPVPVLFTAAQTTSIVSATIAGADPGDFHLVDDSCTGITLAANQDCTVTVGFDPVAPGTRTATLTLTGSDGGTHSVPLQGFTYGGTTRLTISNSAGFPGPAGSYSYGGPASNIYGFGTTQLLQFGGGTNGWGVTLKPPAGEQFTSGTTYPDAQWIPTDGGPTMDIAFDNSTCDLQTGQFTLNSATFDSGDNATSYDVTFSQQCDDPASNLQGEMQWRAGDDVAPAPWMAPDATGFTPPPGGGGPTGGGTTGGGTTGGGTTGGGTSGGSGPPSETAPGEVTSAAGASQPTKQTATRSDSSAVTAAQLAAIARALNRTDQRTTRVTRLTPGHVTTARLRAARRSVVALQAELASAKRSLRALGGAAIRSIIARFGAWQTTLAAERRLLAQPRSRISSSLLELIARANAEGAATIRALVALSR